MLKCIRITSVKQGFLREYHIPTNYNLYDIHRFIQSDMDFDPSQIAVYQMLSTEGKIVAQYSLFDTGDGSMDTITLDQTAETSKKMHCRLVYTFDLYNKRSFYIEILDNVERLPRTTYPFVAISEGETPNQFEDKTKVEKIVPKTKFKPIIDKEEDELELDEDDDEDIDDLDDKDDDDDDDIENQMLDENDLDVLATRTEV